MAELKTFLFTDICGSVRLKNEMAGSSVTERDLAFIQTVLTPHRQRIEGRLIEMGGRVVSTAGDGHFLVFDNTIQAAQWAVAVQESHRDEPIMLPSGDHVEVRMSVHVGVPQTDPGDVDNFVGKSVDYAARLNDYATGGQILVSRSVMAILDDVGLDGIRLYLQGRRELKGIGLVEVHELLYDDVGPRTMRNEPKSHSNRQWTVIPTMGFGEDEGDGGVAVVGSAIKQVGNYVLEGQIGAGGMGDVYKARHKQFDRVRAVKVIKPQFVGRGHGEVISRFYNEIKAVGKLEHKNIVVAIDSSAPTDRVHYLVMEYLDGVGLDDLVAQVGPLATADACEIIRQAAQGLEYIHKHDMVHRDIKPSNLMLTLVDADQLHSDLSKPENNGDGLGVVKILDLGLALLADQGNERLTRYDNKAMGTGMYMPPEQWRTTSVDIRADIYSLGCTLYHLLAGHPPYVDSDLRPEKAHEKEPLPTIRNANIPRKLWDVLKKMTAKRLSDRYATPTEVVTALAPFLEGHDLAGLRHRYDATLGETVANGQSHTPTHGRAPSRQDTLWSKVRSGSGSIYPTRRWMLSTAFPLLAMAVMLGGAVLLQQRNAGRAAEEAERNARDGLAIVARNAARVNLAPQLGERFEILAAAARDPALREALLRINEDPDDASLRAALQDWITKQYSNSSEEAPAESWFVNCSNGIQVARFPSKDSIGKNFAYRNYFHGGSVDLSEEEAKRAKPLIDPKLSAVYESSTSHKLKVAFSMPIWNAPASGEKRDVLGVLAMSVDLGSFEGLEASLRGINQVVLVDTRPDAVAGKAGEGLILDHPFYSHKADPENPPRVSDEVLAKLKTATTNGDGQFLNGYTDPLAEKKEQLFWGAYEPVEVTLKSEEDRKLSTGWVVLAQAEVFE
ncbi:protein kinase domain-containing protein [Adhaeretor mobilis]|uniref:Serine/threonine-protein kinase PknB n=1 Tax=Adhaeretor mobilis TaxID=1930276 RepID=A0A517N0I9_9BACT|nr:protein kinase [Adhaeretor mobilis]QDT00655.1 Serine/threonine-protein kinase PknB [Adhaeretor mobilis]